MKTCLKIKEKRRTVGITEMQHTPLFFHWTPVQNPSTEKEHKELIWEIYYNYSLY